MYLWYGEDQLALEEKLHLWLERFYAKSDELLDKEELDAATASWQSVYGALTLVPLLGDKRLIIINNIFAKSANAKTIAENLVQVLPQIAESNIVLLINNGEVDKRIKAFSDLIVASAVSYFPKPTLLTAKKQITTYLAKYQYQMSYQAQDVLLNRVGQNSQSLKNELEKLALYADSKEITTEMVEELVAQSPQSRIFEMVDALYAGNITTASKLLFQELEYGTAPLQITSLLITQTRRLIMIKDAAENRQAPPQIPGVMPFVMNKLQQTARKTDLKSLVQFYRRLVIADSALKSGSESEAVLLPLVRATF